jgi:hypothetical protein
VHVHRADLDMDILPPDPVADTEARAVPGERFAGDNHTGYAYMIQINATAVK